MRRVIGKLNTWTDDGRIIKALQTQADPNDPIPVSARGEHPAGLTTLIGTATWGIEGDDIVAEITLRSDCGVNAEDLNPHMEVYLVNGDVGILKGIFFDERPDAFGDLNPL